MRFLESVLRQVSHYSCLCNSDWAKFRTHRCHASQVARIVAVHYAPGSHWIVGDLAYDQGLSANFANTASLSPSAFSLPQSQLAWVSLTSERESKTPNRQRISSNVWTERKSHLDIIAGHRQNTQENPMKCQVLVNRGTVLQSRRHS